MGSSLGAWVFHWDFHVVGCYGQILGDEIEDMWKDFNLKVTTKVPNCGKLDADNLERVPRNIAAAPNLLFQQPLSLSSFQRPSLSTTYLSQVIFFSAFLIRQHGFRSPEHKSRFIRRRVETLRNTGMDPSILSEPTEGV